jgi:ABC-type branched-subunit amino acid transport system substrate-binding protein
MKLDGTRPPLWRSATSVDATHVLAQIHPMNLAFLDDKSRGFAMIWLRI